MDFLEIDGSFGEGGGQILRVASGLSAVTGKPVRISDIRANRPQPGLKPQHLKGLEAVARLCNARVSGLSEGSTKIEFSPGKLAHEHLKIDVGTAGSIGLVFQSLMIPAVHTDKALEFDITGGTDVSWSPNIAYFREVFCSFLRKMGIEAEVRIQRHGFYPKGGGRVILKVNPGNLKPIDLTERGSFIHHNVFSTASENLKQARVAERQAEAALRVLGSKSVSTFSYAKTLSPGSSILSVAKFDNTILGSVVLGERGKPAERVGGECAELLKRQLDSRACLDRWMADQLLPYLALSGKPCKVSVAELTNHAKTSMWVIEKFLPVKFNTEEKEKNARIECRP